MVAKIFLVEKVTKQTKIRKYDGVARKRRQIFCPECGAPSLVYTFKWQTREGVPAKDGTERAGFTAQQLKSAQTDAAADYMNLVYESNPDKLEASYGNLIPVLVQAIKELSTQVKQLQTA